MKFATIVTFLTLSAASVYAVKYETNASRLARGLPPLPPLRRPSTWGARRAQPSNLPGRPRDCNSGQAQCCKIIVNTAVENANALPPTTALVGRDCSPLSETCDGQPVCCENSTPDGRISTACTLINVNL